MKIGGPRPTLQKLIPRLASDPILLAMLAEDTSYAPLSSEPIDLAQRLRGYIEGLVCSADRDKEDPPWLVEQAKKNYTHLPEQEAVDTHRKKMRLRPHMQRWLIKATLNHVLRLEYHLRCFILFLTAQIIELGRAGEPPEPRAPGTPRGLTYAQRQDQEMRENARELPRLNSFKVLTPVIDGEDKRKRPRRSRRSRPYHMLPDDLKVVDAGHVFARLKRLEYVLANADKFAMSLACRAAQHSCHPGRNAACSSLEQVSCSRERTETNKHDALQNRDPETTFSGLSGPGTAEQRSTLHCIRDDTPPTALSATHRESAEWREAGGQNNRVKHPLYFAPLANFCPPEEHYDSAPDPEQKRDFNLIHWLASSGLEQIGLGVRPDPYRGLPDLSCLDPPDPPRIRSL